MFVNSFFQNQSHNRSLVLPIKIFVDDKIFFRNTRIKSVVIFRDTFPQFKNISLVCMTNKLKVDCWWSIRIKTKKKIFNLHPRNLKMEQLLRLFCSQRFFKSCTIFRFILYVVNPQQVKS